MSNRFGEKFWRVSKLTLAIGLSAVIATGCSDDDDDNDNEVLTGRLVDSAVAGVSYETESQSGTTNSDGEFSYEAGETVTFSIGGLTFPATSADALVTPLDLAESDNPYDPAANNIARLLQSLDSDSNPDNGITISEDSVALAEGASLSDWADTSAFETMFGNTFNGDLISAQQAAQHLESTLAELGERVSLTLVARFNEKAELDESVAEIVAYHQNSESILVINANDSVVDILDASTLPSTELANPLSSGNIELRSSLDVAADVDADQELDSFTAGGINSVAVQGDLMAVAVENDDKQADGVIAFYSLNVQGAASYVKSVVAGALPDNVQISSDGAYAVVANEGEPNDDYSDDPEGSVTVIAISNGVPADTGTQVTFTDFNEGQSRAAEVSDVRISHPDASVAQDLEPEYVAFSADNSKAYVSMQENNAIAVIDVAGGSVDSIFSLGYKDYSVEGNGLDASNRDECTQEDIDEMDCDALNDGININTWANLRGLYMPDSIAAFADDGVNYVVTANEGDAREYIYEEVTEQDCENAGHTYDDGECISWIDEARIKDLELDPTVFSEESVQDNENLGRLKAILTEGDTDEDNDYDVLYSFGTRSFSIFNADSGALVFDSGDDFEQITATAIGTVGFNATDNENGFDDRSDDKGPEPEALAIGEVDGKRYAFIGLERVGGIMMYDITDPSAPTFVQYTVNRDFGADIEADVTTVGDLAPEGFKFVTGDDSPTGNALLIVGNEVSGTTTVYEVK